MARHFSDDIHDRASQTFGVVDKKNFLAYYIHWRETARQYKDELLEEGLVKSAESVEAFIHHNALSSDSVKKYEQWASE